MLGRGRASIMTYTGTGRREGGEWRKFEEWRVCQSQLYSKQLVVLMAGARLEQACRVGCSCRYNYLALQQWIRKKEDDGLLACGGESG